MQYKLYKVLENIRAARKGCNNLKKAFINVGTYKYFINILGLFQNELGELKEKENTNFDRFGKMIM